MSILKVRTGIEYSNKSNTRVFILGNCLRHFAVRKLIKNKWVSVFISLQSRYFRCFGLIGKGYISKSHIPEYQEDSHREQECTYMFFSTFHLTNVCQISIQNEKIFLINQLGGILGKITCNH